MECKTHGNLGTILRTADSANLKQIILSEDCADPYNPKVVRSTMGAIFRINIIRTKDLIKTLQDTNIKVKIPMLGKTESLNASVAAGIMIYEYVREKLM